MKKIILASLLCVVSSAGFAANACVGGVATAVPEAADGTKFVRTQFSPVCSPNTTMVYTDNGAKVYGGAASVKGATYYGASTEGGTVKKVGECANKNCGGQAAATGAAAGMADAETYGSSS